MAIICGSIIGGVVAGGCGYGIGYAFYGDDDDEDVRLWLPIGLAIYGFYCGLILCHCVLMVLHSAVIAIFVCYAEDPAALYENRINAYNQIVQAKPDFGVVYQSYGRRGAGGAGNAGDGGVRSGQQAQYGPAVTTQLVQPVVVYQPPPPQQQQQQQQQVIYQQQPPPQYQPQQQQQLQYPQLNKTDGGNDYTQV